MYDYKHLSTAFAAILILLTLASAQDTTKEAAVLPSSFGHRHREVPDDVYVPVLPEDVQTSPAYSYQGPGFFTTQVNVDFLGDNIVGDAANEPSIAIDPTDPGSMVIGWRQFDTISSSFRQAGYGYTTDSGQTWTFPGVIEPGVFRSDPVLDEDSDGTFYYNSLSYDNDGFICHVFRSTDGGATWDSGTFAHGGDKEWMVIDRTGGIGDGNIYSYWTSSSSRCLPGFFTRSIDGGGSFEDCITIPDDPYWGTMAVGPDGELYICGGTFVVAKSTNAQDPGQSILWDFSTTVDLDGTFGFGIGPNPGGLLGQAWIAVDHSAGSTRGNVYLLCSVVRNSSPDVLDVMFSRSTDGGLTWSSPVRVNDDTDDSAYQWFGTMSVAPTGRIDVVWLDTRDDPGGYNSSLYYSCSNDAGINWAPNQRLTDSFDPHIGWPQQDKMGDYFDMISDSTGAHLAWAATFNGEQDVYYAHITPVIYVPDDYATIQEAIDAADDGNTVIVRQGTYHERDIDFLGKAITLMSTDPKDSMVVMTTIIDSDSLSRGFHFHSGEDSASVLSGLTITEGFVMNESGGGILCENSSSPMITNCIIDGNYASRHGGGVGCENASPTISDCVIGGNEAWLAGGGISFKDSSAPVIRECTIRGNWARAGGGGISGSSTTSPVILGNLILENSVDVLGGGILILGDSAIIDSNIIQGNSAGTSGGGIHCSGNSTIKGNTISNNISGFGGGIQCYGVASPTIAGNTISGNSADSGGGGINCEDESSPTIINNTLTDNVAQSGGGIYSSSTSTPTVTNTILWGNDASEGPQIWVGDTSSLTISYSDARGGEDSVFVEEGATLDWGPGMIDLEPLLRDAENGDFHLMATACGDTADSPCIDAGDPVILDLVLDCSHGLGEGRSDMGAFGGGEEAPVMVEDEGEYPDHRTPPKAFSLSQNYPNPFNPSTTITFDIPEATGIKQHVILTIYDIRGRCVRTLVDADFEPGRYRIVWDGQNERGAKAASGIYLCTLRVGKNFYTRKMTMLK